jgi:hypothetical protein
VQRPRCEILTTGSGSLLQVAGTLRKPFIACSRALCSFGSEFAPLESSVDNMNVNCKCSNNLSHKRIGRSIDSGSVIEYTCYGCAAICALVVKHVAVISLQYVPVCTLCAILLARLA